jgi:hypothetical protein
VQDTNLFTIWKRHINYADSYIGDFVSVDMRGELTKLLEMRKRWRGAEAVGYEKPVRQTSPLGHGERGGERRRPSALGGS